MYNSEVISLATRRCKAPYLVGEWLSLVEHLVRDQGVGGSNPLSPTNYIPPFVSGTCRHTILAF
jgi:hypothetical protein